MGSKVFTRLLFSRPNQFWIGDYHEAPILWDPVRERFLTVHLSAFLDHFSKVCVPWPLVPQRADLHSRRHLEEGLPHSRAVRQALCRQRTTYRSGDFAFACEHLGVRMVHSKAHTSEGRGTIERFNRSVADGFEPEARAVKIESLEQLNLCFEAWLDRAITWWRTAPPASRRWIASRNLASRPDFPTRCSCRTSSGCASSAESTPRP